MGLVISQRTGDVFVMGETPFETVVSERETVRFWIGHKKITKHVQDSCEIDVRVKYNRIVYIVTIVPFKIHAASCSLNITAHRELPIRRIEV